MISAINQSKYIFKNFLIIWFLFCLKLPTQIPIRIQKNRVCMAYLKIDWLGKFSQLGFNLLGGLGVR